MDSWVGYAQLLATSALACIVAFYGRKYGKTFEAAKQAEVEAKNAWIAKLEGELRLLREMSSENVRKHTIAMKEQLDSHIAMLEAKIDEMKQELEREKEIGAGKQAKIDVLSSGIKSKMSELQKIQELSSEQQKLFGFEKMLVMQSASQSEDLCRMLLERSIDSHKKTTKGKEN